MSLSNLHPSLIVLIAPANLMSVAVVGGVGGGLVFRGSGCFVGVNQVSCGQRLIS